ncbi:MAG TPA: adenylate/guanylate cyclase domain-containing protein [bacterium]|nr:adenylate/guanylate cyclase domain-containing protein [bacterium]
MRTVRARLIAIVALCVLPAIGSAVLRARDAEQDLLDEIRDRVRSADAAFESELEEDRANARLGAELAAGDARVSSAVAAHDPRAAAAAVKLLGDVYTDTVVVLVDDSGRILAANDPHRAPVNFGGADTAPLFAGRELSGLFPLTLGTGAGYSFVVAIPIVDAGKVLGAVAMITPVDPDYLEHIEKKIGSNLAVKVNDVLVAACGDHPAPTLENHGGGVVTLEKNGRLFALDTFRPTLLQRAGQDVEVTASEDTTQLTAEARRDLLKSLAVLGVVLLGALIWAAIAAGRIADAVKRISAAAARVAQGGYERVTGVATRDELEQLAGNFNTMVAGLEETERIKSNFGKFVTRQFIERILATNPQLGQGELVPVTVLFSDIRGFTTMSENMEPRKLLDLLNEYFTEMVDAVMRHGGEVDKFIGDALMAVFGKYEQSSNDALNAVSAAIEMRSKLRVLNQRLAGRGLPEIRAGIGIHTGKVVAGLMGHHEKMEFAVLGDAVNLASRLESVTKDLGVDILLSEDTYAAIKDRIEAEPIRRVNVKGRAQDVMVYRLVGLTGSASATRPPSGG